MTIIAVFPKHDKVYQEFHIKQIIIAKNRIAHFPILNNIFENFLDYEDLKWKESRNKVFLEFTIRPVRFPLFGELDMIIGKSIKTLKNKSSLFYENEGKYPDSAIDLENAIEIFGKSRWTPRQFNEFKKRITNFDYFVSDSAYSEIMMAYDLAKSIGFDNIFLNPSITSGKNSDILLKIEKKKIFLELTTPTFKLSEIKIRRVFEDLASYLGNKKWNIKFNFIIWVNTLRFIFDEKGNIDEEKSKKMLRWWVEKIHLDKLAGCDALVQLDYKYYAISGEKYLSELVDGEIAFLPSDLMKNIKEQNRLRKWAEAVEIGDLNSCPFSGIGCGTEGDGVYIEVEGNTSYPSAVGQLEEKSFFNKIQQSIRQKIKNGQYEKESPAVIVLKVSFWANWFEEDDRDFLKIKPIMEKELNKSTFVSGVLIYSSNYRNGRYIHNKNCTSKIRIDDSDLKKLNFRI